MAQIENQLSSVQLLVDLVLRSSKVPLANRDDLRANLSRFVTSLTQTQARDPCGLGAHELRSRMHTQLCDQGDWEPAGTIGPRRRVCGYAEHSAGS